MHSLTDMQKAGMFKMLKDKNMGEVGFEYGLDRFYKDAASMKTAVSRIYNNVKNNPEQYGVSIELVKEVEAAVNSRFQTIIAPEKRSNIRDLSLREQRELINPEDIKGLVLGGRNKAAKLLYEKLDRIGRSKKLLDNIKLSEMATVAAILIDKGQILQGQSTENIAVLSKNVDTSLTPEETLALVLKMRDGVIAEKETK